MPRLISDRVIWRACAALIAAGPAVSLAYADIIVTEGMQPWHLCATCHSLDGISAMARFPKLAGQRAAYIVKQVRDFRDGRRSNDGGQMQASASDVDDDDLAKTAAYFASLPPPPPDGSLERTGKNGVEAPSSSRTVMRLPALRAAVPVTTTRRAHGRTRRC